MVVAGAPIYDVVLHKGVAAVEVDPMGRPDITLRLDRGTAIALASGTRAAHDALDAGEVKVSGDLRALGALTEAMAVLAHALGRVREQTTFS